MTNLPPASSRDDDRHFESYSKLEPGTIPTESITQPYSGNTTADPLALMRRLEVLTQGISGRLASDAWYYLEAVCVLLSVTRTPATRSALLGFAKSPSQLVRRVWESQLPEITAALLSPYITLLLDAGKSSQDSDNQLIQFVLMAIESTFEAQHGAFPESRNGGRIEPD